MTEIQKSIVDRIEVKFKAIDQNPDVHLEGLVYAKPMNYWDYIMPDALLALQVQRTTEPDEMVFVMYHQINELLFKMILWEINQVSNCEVVSAPFFTEKLRRISRYFDMLSSSFDIMGDGMEKDQYMKFRNTLTPASGFQSAQYRSIEFSSTELINLIDYRFRATIDRNTPFEHAFEHLYWQAAGKDHAEGARERTLRRRRTLHVRHVRCRLCEKYGVARQGLLLGSLISRAPQAHLLPAAPAQRRQHLRSC